MPASNNHVWLRQPWAHQREAFERATRMRDYALFFEMGTGKTFTSLNILRWHYTQAKRPLRTVIIAPVVALENWRREFQLATKCVQFVSVAKGTSEKKLEAIANSKGIILINFESFDNAKIEAALQKFKPEIVVVDESQRIKNYKSERTKSIIRLGSHARHRYILSGSPILNSPMDVFAQFHFLDQGETFGENFFAFRATYFEDKNADMPRHKYFPDWRPKPTCFDYIHNAIYTKASRVTKAEALDLPPLVRKDLAVALGKDQAKMYASMEAHLVAYLRDKACVATIALTKVLRLQQMLSGHFVDDTGVPHHFKDCPRMAALEDLLENLAVDAGQKVIVWSCFAETYEPIKALCAKLGLGVVTLVGGMTPAQRQKAIDDFQAESKGTMVMLANQKAGGVAIGLTRASYMVYYAKNFSLEDDLQSEARAHRSGSEIHERITRIDLVATGTVDEKINTALALKQKIAETILGMADIVNDSAGASSAGVGNDKSSKGAATHPQSGNARSLHGGKSLCPAADIAD